MASAHMPDEFVNTLAHHLPPEQPVGPKGGRPRGGHRVVVRVIWFVLTTVAREEDVPAELGCSGRTAHRRLRAWEEAGVWGRVNADRLRLLRKAGELETDTVIIDAGTVRAFGGGEETGPSLVDRRKKGTTHTLRVSRTGVPLAITAMTLYCLLASWAHRQGTRPGGKRPSNGWRFTCTGWVPLGLKG